MKQSNWIKLTLEDCTKSIYQFCIDKWREIPKYIDLKIGKHRFLRIFLDQDKGIEYLLNNGYKEK